MFFAVTVPEVVSTGYFLTITGGTDAGVVFLAFAAGVPIFTQAVDLTVTVTGDVTHLVWGNFWQAGSTFKLINQATIYGKGGNGGDSGQFSGTGDGTNGGNGGDAIELDGMTVSIDNSAGNIWGGGGGGGGGGLGNSGIGAPFDNSAATTAGGGGAGGQGGISNTGGSGVDSTFSRLTMQVEQGVDGPTTSTDILETITQGTRTQTGTILSTDGTGGGLSGAGTNGIGSASTGSVNSTGGAGGDGGAFGAAGTNGGNGVTDGDSTVIQGTGGTGGAAGKAINLGGGTANFLSGNNGTQVVGAVS